jgi:hypothetical protein
MLNPKSIAVLLCLVLSACAAPARNAGVTNATLLDGEGNKESVESMEKELKRGANTTQGHLSGGFTGFMADVLPMTPALIRARERELGKHELKSESEIKNATAEKLKLFTEGKTCFEINVRTPQPIASAQFENFTAKIRDQSGELMPVEFKNVSGVESVPKINEGLYHEHFPWWNIGYACTNKSIELKNGFSFILISKVFKDVPASEMKWSFATAKQR